ncbi:MAG: ABC-2 family transporter protein [Deltaproteobacteria bacterium]|nr:ABC-2 family transporter protein [Deltaproteobacteria bacterium]MBW2067272.1 ABC-2 family transporter protein [Deltaproteobacteria bacterium]
MKRLMKDIKLVGLFMKNAVLIDMEYRAHFLVNTLLSIFWLCFSILTLKLFFYHRTSLGGWAYEESLLVLGLFSFFGSFIEGVLEPNVAKLVEDIRFGNFDFILLKPVNVQLIGTLRSFSMKKLPAMFGSVIICVYALYQLHYMPSIPDIALFLMFFTSGFLILYGLWVALIATAFWFIQIDSIMEFVFAVFETGRFPITVYPTPLRLVLTYIVPIAFITTFPAAAIIGKVTFHHACMALGLAGIILFVGSCFWKYALTRYSSASS